MWALTSRALVVATILVACGGPVASGPTDPEPGAASPQAAVDELIRDLRIPDFESAGHLLVPGQAAVASLAEGATFNQVADAIESGDRSVGSNFWAGFAQGAGGFLSGSVSLGTGEDMAEAGIEFTPVEVSLEDGQTRRLVARDVDGYRIDLFASFGAGLANRMIPPVERLLSTQTVDAKTILPELKLMVPSLQVAATEPGLLPSTHQDLLQLIELITRIN